jgi:hypothetical protein
VAPASAAKARQIAAAPIKGNHMGRPFRSPTPTNLVPIGSAMLDTAPTPATRFHCRLMLLKGELGLQIERYRKTKNPIKKTTPVAVTARKSLPTSPREHRGLSAPACKEHAD